jgi:hypothetical protein
MDNLNSTLNATRSIRIATSQSEVVDASEESDHIPSTSSNYKSLHLIKLNDIVSLGFRCRLFAVGTSGLDGECLWGVGGQLLDSGVGGCSGNSGLYVSVHLVEHQDTRDMKKQGCARPALSHPM